MSFKCEICKKPQESRTKPVVVITSIYGGENGYGYDIAQEEKMCLSCAVSHTGFLPAQLSSYSHTLSRDVRSYLVSNGHASLDCALLPIDQTDKAMMHFDAVNEVVSPPPQEKVT